MSLTSYVQRGDLLDYTPGSNVSAGDMVVSGEQVGQVVADTLSGMLGALRVEGVIRVPKLSTDTTVLGTILYWDAANSRATTTASTHKRLGLATHTTISGNNQVDVKLSR